MADLYAILRVPRTASKDLIKRQFRKRARETHPDCGGTAQDFADVEHAYTVLMDDERRGKYDRLGEDHETEPDNETRDVVDILARCLEHVLVELAERQRRPTQADVVGLMRQAMGDALANKRKEVRAARKAKESLESVLGRFVSARPDNLMELAARRQVAKAEARLREVEAELDKITKGIDILRDVRFKIDQDWASADLALWMLRRTAHADD